jgi:hypothetical protein
MGVLLIWLGCVPIGLMADYLAENHWRLAPAASFALAHGTVRLSQPEVVLAAFVLGASSIVFILLGFGLLRGSWGRRQTLKQRIEDLETENTNLRSREHLAAEVQPIQTHLDDE